MPRRHRSGGGRITVQGTDNFRALAVQLRAAGTEGKGLKRQMVKGLKEAARPLEDRARSNALGIASRGSRGGASARAARAANLLGKRRAGDKAKTRAHRNSGLRQAVARTVETKVALAAKGASMRMVSNRKKMPADQRTLPAHMDAGRWKHPVFGNRENWVWQSVTPGWFTRATKDKGPPARDHAIRTVEVYLHTII